MTTQDTIISIEGQDLVSVETPNFTSIINSVQPAATFLSFFINFPGDYSPYNAIEAFFLTALLLFITFLTIAGNATICFIIIYFKRFRRSNYLVTSLAVSDLLVGVIVMPPAIIYQVSGDWYFGSISCHIWLSADVLNCTASIFNLCMVSIDRFWLIMKPLKYETKRTKLRMSLYITIIWSLAMCISLPPLLTMGNEYVEVENGPTLCALYQHFIYQIYAIVGSFYIPLLVIIPMNYKLFNAARDKSSMNYQEGRFDIELNINIDSSTNRCRNIRSTSCPRHSYNIHLRSANAPEIHLKNATAFTSEDLKRHPAGEREENLLQKSMRILRIRNNQVCICNRRQQRRKRSERKASTTLGIIVGAFVVCWLPFFMLALIRPFYKPDDIPHSVSSLFLWLGYCNSALNPIIYAIFNKEIRKPFILIMCLRWRNLNELMREEYYHQQFGERRTRNELNGNDGTDNTEGANLVDDNNKNTSNNDHDINYNQNVDNNNQNVNNNHQNVEQNAQYSGDNNQNADSNNEDNNQDIVNDKQNIDNKKQNINDNNQVAVDIEESDEMVRF
ncbi:5-hydroxytryptamine receptor 1 [Monomorium pharaonis]|uniref:5-hydroxytryptamine receptor 1 n=1 Tax=Monomorium pharaonis TaxID=307658 RepID=UPI00063FB53B|nr:5-hydroxytryptamine receptor 1 [Monomorium pharaonis]